MVRSAPPRLIDFVDPHDFRTANESKLKRTQNDDRKPANTAAAANANLGIGIWIDHDSGNAEEAADRALSAVARKLDKTLSVEYAVNDLVAEATDPVNLSAMYSGTSVPHLDTSEVPI